VTRGILGRIVEEIGYWLRSDWSLADIAAHYDDLAAHYDEINESTDAHFRRFTDAVRLARLPDVDSSGQNPRVLEIFARTGEGMVYFYQQGKVGSGVCVGVSRKMGEICRQRLQEIGSQDLQWVQMLDYVLPFDNGEFDVVFFLETVEHISQPERLVAELGRVTKPGGTMVLSTPNVLWEPVHALAAITKLHHSEGPHRFIRYGRLLEMVEQAGFHVEYAETNVLVPEGPGWMINLGEWLEKGIMNSLMPLIGLRRFLICRKLN
jgi:ubiquinone/menaquinone biosynthesis C-methylase UbiE